MTPLSRLLGRILPAWACGPVLGLVYGVMMIGVLIASSNDSAQIVYVDVRGK